MDPLAIVGAIQATANAVSDVCKVMLSPEGQALMKQWREDGQEFRRVMGAVGQWFENTVNVVFDVGVNSDGKANVSVKGTAGK